MRLIFMGTSDFAVPTLRVLVRSRHEVAAVYTQPARAAGRGLSLRASPVQVVAEGEGIAVRTPSGLRDAGTQAAFEELGADLAVVVAHGLILPSNILAAPRHGCLNLHASLLPRWRGAAPIQRAIMAGDPETGVAVMRMEPGLDTGPICLSERTSIDPGETAGELHDRLAALGAPLVLRALDAMEASALVCRPQAEEGVTYAAKIQAGDTRIDWSWPAEAVHDAIRGLSPAPGAWFGLRRDAGEERVKVLRSETASGEGVAGRLLDESFTVACGTGAVRLLEVQPGGKRAMGASAYLNGARLPLGFVFSTT